jgi:hypothetical protein
MGLVACYDRLLQCAIQHENDQAERLRQQLLRQDDHGKASGIKGYLNK